MSRIVGSQSVSLIWLLTLCLTGLASYFTLALGDVWAQEMSSNADIVERQTQEISEVVMSPFCPGRTLSACPSGEARALRGRISDWLRQGLTREEVEETLVNLYGTEVRGKPSTAGFGLAAWLTPLVFLLVGLFAILFVVRRPSGVSLTKEEANLDERFTDQVQEELKKRLT